MPDAYELNRRDAERAHDNHAAFVSKMNEAALETGQLALRTTVFINGGAAIAVLAFLGAIAAKDKIGIGQLSAMAGAIVWFAIGVAVGAVGLGCAYLTTYFNGRAAHSHELGFEHPYVEPGPRTKRMERITLTFHVGAVVAAIGAVGLFVWGMIGVRAAVVLLGASG